MPKYTILHASYHISLQEIFKNISNYENCKKQLHYLSNTVMIKLSGGSSPAQI